MDHIPGVKPATSADPGSGPEPAQGGIKVIMRGAMEKRTSMSVIEEVLALDNAIVIDVGCGDGWLTRELTKRGAHVTGIEVSPRQLAMARAVPPVGDEHYLQGYAEDLPVASRSADIIVFYNSLHHVVAADLDKAMKESARVLRHGGVLYVSEPVAEGPYFELMKPVHDETEVRRKAQDIIRRASEFNLLVEKQLSHVDTVAFADFHAFHDRLTTINPNVREMVVEKESELEESFNRLGQAVATGRSFDQPMRVVLLRRP